MKKIILVGNIGNRSPLRFTKNQTPNIGMTLAVNTKIKGDKVTDWFKVNLWGKLAEALDPYLAKGGKVYVEGVPKIDMWTSKKGESKAQIEVDVRDIELLGGKKEIDEVTNDIQERFPIDGPTNIKEPELTEDDIPF